MKKAEIKIKEPEDKIEDIVETEITETSESEAEDIKSEDKAKIENIEKEYTVLIGFLGDKKRGEKIKLSEKEAQELLKEGFIEEV